MSAGMCLDGALVVLVSSSLSTKRAFCGIFFFVVEWLRVLLAGPSDSSESELGKSSSELEPSSSDVALTLLFDRF
jgi:hypothetical protein